MLFRMDLSHALRNAAVCTLLSAFAAVSHAASVRAVGTSDLAAQSGFVFHGKAVEKWVAAGSRPGSIVTHMRFTVLDVLKGNRSQDSVVLSFLGGTLNGKTLRVGGLTVPRVGEEGVFFVERLGGNLVQPFYGWDQGRFTVQTDSLGRKIVVTHDQQPVRRVEKAAAGVGIAAGHAAGIITSNDQRDALTVDAFKTQIRAILETQQ